MLSKWDRMHLENIILSESYQAQDPIYVEGVS